MLAEVSDDDVLLVMLPTAVQRKVQKKRLDAPFAGGAAAISPESPGAGFYVVPWPQVKELSVPPPAGREFPTSAASMLANCILEAGQVLHEYVPQRHDPGGRRGHH